MKVDIKEREMTKKVFEVVCERCGKRIIGQTENEVLVNFKHHYKSGACKKEEKK